MLLATVLACAAASAAPPPWAGGGKGDHEAGAKHDRKARNADDRSDTRRRGDDGGKGRDVARKPQPGAYFNDRSRDAVTAYYGGRGGKACPPGLAKKNNGCLPPGQAKKQWHVGQPLPPAVVLAPVPRQIVIQLPPVPAGHRYVEVAGDILLIAVGTRMVVDGINGLMR
jgi:Ni/Co efflux regulator RcnB